MAAVDSREPSGSLRRGLHPTAAAARSARSSPLSAALADRGSARLAIAFSVMRTGGTRGAFGSDGKAIQVGLAAAAGLQAALMAQAGAIVDPRAIHGPLGFAAVLGDRRGHGMTGSPRSPRPRRRSAATGSSSTPAASAPTRRSTPPRRPTGVSGRSSGAAPVLLVHPVAGGRPSGRGHRRPVREVLDSVLRRVHADPRPAGGAGLWGGRSGGEPRAPARSGAVEADDALPAFGAVLAAVRSASSPGWRPRRIARAANRRLRACPEGERPRRRPSRRPARRTRNRPASDARKAAGL